MGFILTKIRGHLQMTYSLIYYLVLFGGYNFCAKCRSQRTLYVKKVESELKLYVKKVESELKLYVKKWSQSLSSMLKKWSHSIRNFGQH